MEKTINVGIIGCGNISGAYFRGCKPYGIIRITACADIEPERAKAKGAEFGVRACSVEELLRDPDIQIVVNLTVPKAHAAVNLQILQQGKHAYCEKPFAVNRADGEKVLAFAKEKNLRVGCAPDTFFGGGIQTCRKLIDDGAIGEPIAATAFMVCHGHESWHPNAFFYYEKGGGPMLDMGPYYLTALVNLIGPIKRVAGSTRITFKERIATSEALKGRKIPVETPTHITGVMDFSNDAIGTIIQSFDVWSHNLPIIEIYGTEGSLCVPDPNGFGGSVRLRKAGQKEWTEIQHTHRTDVARGIGVADMAYGLVYGRPHRASGELANHVLDVMLAFEDSSNSNQHVKIKNQCQRPAALPTGLELGVLDK